MEITADHHCGEYIFEHVLSHLLRIRLMQHALITK